MLFAKLIHPMGLVLPKDMVDNSLSPFQTPFGLVFGVEGVQTGLLFLELGSLRMLLRAPSSLCSKHETAPPSGLDASQAHPFGKGHASTSPVVHRRFVFPAAIAGLRWRSRCAISLPPRSHGCTSLTRRQW